MPRYGAAITAMILVNRAAVRLKTATRNEERVMKSILQREKKCWVTGDRYNLHEHHIFGGARRKLSEKYGLKVYLRCFLGGGGVCEEIINGTAKAIL